MRGTRCVFVDIAYLTGWENLEDPHDIQPEIRMGRDLLLVGRFVEQGDKSLIVLMTPLILVLAVDLNSGY